MFLMQCQYQFNILLLVKDISIYSDHFPFHEWSNFLNKERTVFAKKKRQIYTSKSLHILFTKGEGDREYRFIGKNTIRKRGKEEGKKERKKEKRNFVFRSHMFASQNRM